MSQVDPYLADDIANLIKVAFKWSETDEGYEYWEEVFKRLQGYAGNGPRMGGLGIVMKENEKPILTPTMRKIEVTHILDKGETLCGLKLNDMLPHTRKWVNISNKANSNCHLCKSKAPL